MKKIFSVFLKRSGGEYVATREIVNRLKAFTSIEFYDIEINAQVLDNLSGKFKLIRYFTKLIFISFDGIFRFRKILFSADEIYSTSLILILICLCVTKMSDKKIYYHFHGFEIGENDKNIWKHLQHRKEPILIKLIYILPILLLVYSIERWTIRKAHQIIVPDAYSIKILSFRYPFLNRNIFKIAPNGVDKKIFYPSKIDGYVPFSLLFVGRLVEEKGILQLLTAFQKLHIQGSSLTIVYPIAPDDMIIKRIDMLINEQYNVRIIQNPKKELLASIYRSCDLTIIPSCESFEQFPLVYIESIASGTPTLVSPKIRSLIPLQKTIHKSLILRSCDSQDIVQSIREFMEFSKRKKIVIREKCLTVAKQYSWEKSAKVVHDIIS